MTQTDHTQAFLDRLPALYTDPTTLGPLAVARRAASTGNAISITPAARIKPPPGAAVVRGDAVTELERWPASADCSPADRIVVTIPATADARKRYVRWLVTTEFPDPTSLAPCSHDQGALHLLWCIAVTRLVAGPHVRVEARHDLLGIRLAQLALGMGADTLSGPIEPDRHLPLAGVPRPTETTRDGLTALVTHAGLSPETNADTEPGAPSPGPPTA